MLHVPSAPVLHGSPVMNAMEVIRYLHFCDIIILVTTAAAVVI